LFFIGFYFFLPVPWQTGQTSSTYFSYDPALCV
jgi:hypothetical protein